MYFCNFGWILCLTKITNYDKSVIFVVFSVLICCYLRHFFLCEKGLRVNFLPKQ